MDCLPDGRIFLEVDPDVYGQALDPRSAARAEARAANLTDAIDWGQVEEVIARTEGLARQVGEKKQTFVACNS